MPTLPRLNSRLAKLFGRWIQTRLLKLRSASVRASVHQCISASVRSIWKNQLRSFQWQGAVRRRNLVFILCSRHSVQNRNPWSGPRTVTASFLFANFHTRVGRSGKVKDCHYLNSSFAYFLPFSLFLCDRQETFVLESLQRSEQADSEITLWRSSSGEKGEMRGKRRGGGWGGGLLTRGGSGQTQYLTLLCARTASTKHRAHTTDAHPRSLDFNLTDHERNCSSYRLGSWRQAYAI